MEEKKNSNTMKKAVTSIIFLFISVVFVFAQEGYRLTVRQVFPSNKEVYKNSFDFKRELDNAISSQTARYRGNSNNYTLIINTPSGRETRFIQNINWIQTVNGVKTYLKAKTEPDSSYPIATVWSGSACKIDGSPKGETITYEFIYRVAEGATENYKSEFIEKTSALAMAEALYTENLTADKLVQYVVYRFDGDSITSVFEKNNEIQYNEYLAAKKAEEERLEAERQLAANVDGFRGKMDVLRSAKDSLKLEGIHLCLEVLESTTSVIPDSIFVKERLDTVYRVALINDFLPKKGKDYKKIKQHVERLEDECITSRDSLLNYTRSIESILFPSNKK